MASLWLIDPTALKVPTGTKRTIGRKPLIDLAGLQTAIDDGTLDDDDVWLATRDCEKDLQKFPWSVRDLLHCVRCLKAFDPKGRHDFRGSVWCKSSSGKWFPCDAYAIRYDEARRCRSRVGLEIYLKFSIAEDGVLTLVMISAHV